MNDKFILDACCGNRYMWFDKNHPNALYIDIRKEPKGFNKRRKNEEVNPDFIMDFRDLKFEDKKFKLIVWDVPHLKSLGETSILRKTYGCLNAETWQYDLKQGFKECWRCLEDYGILIFKFNDLEIKFKEVLKYAPCNPLFQNTTNNKATSVTKWFCFMKIPKSCNIDGVRE